jgi:cyclase
MQDLGAGEILVSAMSREGSRRGLDLELVARISKDLRVPLVINGGAGSVDDFAPAVRAGAAAVAAGTMFTFHGPRKAVLVQYPSDAALNAAFGYTPEVAEIGSVEGAHIERKPSA